MDTMRIVPLDTLFESVGIEAKGSIDLNDNTYDFNPEAPKDHWLYGALLGFEDLKRQGFSPETFATIGTGSGTDSIGAYHIFHPKEIYQTDIHPNVLDIAERNAKRLIPSSVPVSTYQGDLCAPLIERGIKVDLLYANIPNVPSDVPVWNGTVSASRFERGSLQGPEIFDKWLLTLQYAFLQQAKQALSPAGVVAVAIGDRVPRAILEQMFIENGYHSEELITIYKIQTEPEEIITGYADQELKAGVTFEFYDHEYALLVWRAECEGKNMSVDEIKLILREHQISATEALKRFRNEGKSAGHLYSIFKLTPA